MENDKIKKVLEPVGYLGRDIKNHVANAVHAIGDFDSHYKENREFARKALPLNLASILRDIDALTKVAVDLRKAMGEPEAQVEVTLTHDAREALSNIITTATEGGEYTFSDFRKWEKYKHYDEDGGRFYAEVTVTPNDDVEGIPLDPIRMTPEELGKRLKALLDSDKLPKSDKGLGRFRSIIFRLLDGDEDIAGECDVIDAGALMQLAVYGEVVYG